MNDDDGPDTKVRRVIRTYGLADMGQTLEAAWTGQTGERTSLRDLADEFNKTVLEAAVREASNRSVDIDILSTYETLQNGTGEEVTRAKRRLERKGVTVDKLTTDFVSHQAIHTYLTEDREASLPDTDENRAEQKIETIEKLQSRLSAVTESAISSLSNDGKIDTDDYDVLVDVRTVCPHCGADVSARQIITRGGCDCEGA